MATISEAAVQIELNLLLQVEHIFVVLYCYIVIFSAPRFGLYCPQCFCLLSESHSSLQGSV